MVPTTRTAVRAPQLRSLNQPAPIRVRLNAEGIPAALLLGEGWREVIRPRSRWRIDDRWWREGEEICRIYWELELSEDRIETIFEDRLTGQWYRQRYA